MLIDVLTRLASDTGLDIVSQRTTLTTILNNAAKEMYDRLECNKVYWEDTMSVPINKIITLPSYIYELRGMRATLTEMPFDLKSIGSPRYVRKDWSYRWRNWRDLGESPTMINPSVVGPLTITSPIVESSPITVMISGQTNLALRIEEKVVVDATSKTTTKLFGPQIYTICCLNADRSCDINISDANGQLLATLYNMDNFTRYKIIDVSEAPWSVDTTNGNSLIDVMWKVILRKLTKDSDSFPASADYDTAWYWMAMWLYYKPMQNKPQDYDNYLPLCLTTMKAIKDGNEGSIDKRISYGRNRFFDLTKGYRVYPGAITHIDRV